MTTAPWSKRSVIPTVVEEFDSTTVVHPGFTVRVDDVGNLVIERGVA